MHTTLKSLRTLLGPDGWVEPDRQAPYLREWRGQFHGRAAAVLRPGCTAEVAEIVQRCQAASIAIVAQSGNTGLVGGAAPDASGRQVLLSLDRMTTIRAVDAVNRTVTVEAGCTLADLQRAVAEHDRLFPLQLAAAEQTRVGGILATNAGGINVLHYGNARALTLGLEVVLADGRIYHGLRGLRKDNAGYDLRDLFIGSEGTLGIITAAVFRLFSRPAQDVSLLLGVDQLPRALVILEALQAGTGERLVGCELMSRFSLEAALSQPGREDPLPRKHPWYLLLRVTDSDASQPLAERLQRLLDDLPEGRHCRLAVEPDDRQVLWGLRTGIPAGQATAGASIKHDISVPVSQIPAFVDAVIRAVQTAVPGVRPCIFGHLGDGNLHVNLSQPEGMERQRFLDQRPTLNAVVHDLTHQYDGSIAAEHGIGQLKRDALRHYGDPVAITLMERIKTALDPEGLLNPGKVL